MMVQATVPMLGRFKQEDHEFNGSVGYTVKSLWLNNKPLTNNTTVK